jgi:hypothetical protein
MKFFELYFKKRPTRSYYIACEIAKKAYSHEIIDNFPLDEESINHKVVFTEEQLPDLNLLYGVIKHQNANEGIIGFDIFGVDLKYIRNKVLYYDSIIHFCGWQINLESNQKEFSESDTIIKKLIQENRVEEVKDFVRKLIIKIQKEYECVVKTLLEYNYKRFGYSSPFELSKEVDPIEFNRISMLVGKKVRTVQKEYYSRILENLIITDRIPLKWKSEGSLYKLVLSLYNDTRFQYIPEWLEPQSLDVYIPSLNVAIEYQGQQHFTSVDFFGGELSLERQRELDNQKKELCRVNGIHLIDWRYDEDITEENLINKLNQHKQGAVGQSDQTEQIIPIVGITQNERIEYVKRIQLNDSVKLKRDPENPYDSNAIKAFDASDNFIGYVGKDMAQVYSPKMEVGECYYGKVAQKKSKVLKVRVNFNISNS